MPIIGTAAIPAVANFYMKLLLERAGPYLIHQLGGLVRSYPQRSGKTVTIRGYSALSVDTAPLVEGVTPASKNVTATDITQTLAQHGAYLEHSELFDFTNEENAVNMEFTELLGENAGQVVDTLVRNELANTTNIQYAGAAVSSATIAAGMVLSNNELTEAKATLRAANIRPITTIQLPGSGVGSSPLAPAYLVKVDSDIADTVEGLTGFVPVQAYARFNPIHESEIGYCDGFRFLWTTNGYVEAGVGVGGIDVYHTFIMGRVSQADAGQPFVVMPLAGNDVELIIKPVGSGGVTDPLNQRGTLGWKRTGLEKILNDACVLDLVHSQT